MSPMFLLQQFAPGMIVGAVFAFCFAMIARSVAADWAKQMVFAAAVGGGYAAGHAKSAGWPAFPPGDATHWLLFSALAAIILGFLFGVSRDRWGSGRVASFAVLFLGTLALLLVPKFKYGWTVGQGATWVAALAFAGAGAGWALDAATRAGTKGFSLLWFLVVAAGASIALAISGSMMLGQLGAVLSAVVFALNAAAAFGARTERAVVPGLATLFLGLIASGYFYAELPWSSALLLVISPAACLLIRGEPTVRKELLRAAITAVPVGAAVVLAVRASPPVDYY